jgi:hypothetical protein
VTKSCLTGRTTRHRQARDVFPLACSGCGHDDVQGDRVVTVEVLGPERGRLADLLGDDHDPAVLVQALGEAGDRPGLGEAARAIRPLIEGRRAELRRDAFALGQVVYGERPGRFLARCVAYRRARKAEWEAARIESP